ncbi:hypothetical protein H8959_021164 [Pygathrix nigripes]
MSPGGSPRRYLLFRRPPPTPSPPSPAALCGEKERAPSPPPFSSPGGRASVNRQPRQLGCGRRAGPALPHAVLGLSTKSREMLQASVPLPTRRVVPEAGLEPQARSYSCGRCWGLSGRGGSRFRSRGRDF